MIKLIISYVRLFMIISHVKIIAFQTITNHSFWAFYIGGKPVVYTINRKIHGCLEKPDLFLVLNIISLNTRNKSDISAHPCITLCIMTVSIVLNYLILTVGLVPTTCNKQCKHNLSIYGRRLSQ